VSSGGGSGNKRFMISSAIPRNGSYTSTRMRDPRTRTPEKQVLRGWRHLMLHPILILFSQETKPYMSVARQACHSRSAALAAKDSLLGFGRRTKNGPIRAI